MILLLCATIVIVVLAVIAIIRSDKPVKLILAEAKYELIFQSLGSRNLLNDWMMRGQNKTDLPISSGKVAVVTGGTRGIGLQVVKMLLKCDLKVVIGCRNVQMAQMVLEKFRNEGISSGSLEALPLDISVIKSVGQFAAAVTQKYEKVNYLINCAGIMNSPAYIETRDGFESLFATNYLGHFLLTHLLLPHIRAAGTDELNARIVNVSSCAYLAGDIKFDDINNRDMYVPLESYAQSKLAQMLFTNYVDAQMKAENAAVQVHSVHPGLVDTEIFEGQLFKKISPWLSRLFFKTPEEGARSVVYACLSPALEGLGGNYITNCQITDVNSKSQCAELQKKLFDFTMKLLKIERFGEIQK